MSVLVFHPSVASFVQQVAKAFHEVGQLQAFYTTLRNDETSRWQSVACKLAKLAHYDLRTQLRRRTINEIPVELVHGFPMGEVLRLASGPFDRSGRLTDLVWSWSEPSFDRKVARNLPNEINAVYGFEYSSLATFRAARERGLKVIYDLPAPEPHFVQAILNREVTLHPVLATPFHAHTEQREEQRIARRQAERDLADVILCASAFTKKTYVSAGLDPGRIHVVPLGAPPPVTLAQAMAGGNSEGPLRVLWAGTFSVRKGAHYLLEAWRKGKFGKNAILRIHGSITLPDELLHPLPAGVEIGGSIPRDRLMEVYQQSDVLIFPTLCDGFGMVATEAWSRGLPVITTSCAGVADLLVPGRNGLLIEAGGVDGVTTSIEWCLQHRTELQAMREEAIATAARWQWADYRRTLARLVSSTIGM
jgi:glycosyltransferase involved in cell wall biosynthesis